MRPHALPALAALLLLSVGCAATGAQARRLKAGMSYAEVAATLAGVGETRSLVARPGAVVRHVVYPGDPRSRDLHLGFRDGKLAGAALLKRAAAYPDLADTLDAWLADCGVCAEVSLAWRGLHPSRYANLVYASQEALEGVEAGIPSDEVRRRLGRPAAVKRVEGEEAWEYHRPGDVLGPRVYAVGFRDGKVAWIIAHWHGTPSASPWQWTDPAGTDEAFLAYLVERLGYRATP
jgi:hypothetical protein